MHALPTAQPGTARPALRRGLVAAAIVVMAGTGLWLLNAARQQTGTTAVMLNPCNGEVITLRDSSHLLPHVAPAQVGSREASVDAVGLSGVGSLGTYYLPMGTGKVVLSLAHGGIDLAVGGDLELVGRAAQSPDFRLHGMGHLKMSAADGLDGSGLTMHSQCGP